MSSYKPIEEISLYAKEKAAQAWCKDRAKSKTMDVDLCHAFAEIIDEITGELKAKILTDIKKELFGSSPG